MTTNQDKAVSAYVLLSMDMEGYIDSLSDMASDVKELLAELLNKHNPKHCKEMIELNALGMRLLSEFM